MRFENKSCGIAPVSRNFREDPGGFLCTSAVWRSRQSGANLSLPKFPANRELLKNLVSKTALFLSTPHISEGKHFSDEKPSREFSGAEQGNIRDLQGFKKRIRDLLIRGAYEAARTFLPGIY